MQIYFTTFRLIPGNATSLQCAHDPNTEQSYWACQIGEEFEWGQTIPEQVARCGPEVRNSPSEQGLHKNNIKIPTTAETISNEEPVHGGKGANLGQSAQLMARHSRCRDIGGAFFLQQCMQAWTRVLFSCHGATADG